MCSRSIDKAINSSLLAPPKSKDAMNGMALEILRVSKMGIHVMTILEMCHKVTKFQPSLQCITRKVLDKIVSLRSRIVDSGEH